MSNLIRPHIQVYERNGDWSRALRRYLPANVHVIETALDTASAAEHEPSSRVVLWVVADAEDAALGRQLAVCRARSPARGRDLMMAVVRPASSDAAWTLRDLGFWLIWDEFWQVPRMARLIIRFWSCVSVKDLSVEERIWNNLPWGSEDTAYL